jgi:hypothetical protein
MDFITGLPVSNGFDSILVVVDRLSKMAHFIPTTADGCDAKETARLIRDHVFKLHGTPNDSISDRGSVFVSQFFRELSALLNVKLRPSTAFHPQTDGQTERVNAILEQYIRGYCNYQQDNWADLLSMAEFAYNNTSSATTKMTPFFANYGFHPKYTLELRPGKPLPRLPEIKDLQTQFQNLDKYLSAEMTYAQSVYAEQADKGLRPAPMLKEGDYVWLKRGNLQTTRPSPKLDFKRVGKFKIEKKVSSHAYKLELPPSMKVHPVFHISLLEPASNDPLQGQTQPPPPPTIIAGQQEWDVEEILEARTRYRKPHFLVKWTGHQEPTWEPPEHLNNSPLKVREFYNRYPNAPRFQVPPPDPDSDEEDV